MPLKICEKRQRILNSTGHTLVTGGPGSGKTTIAILKALRRIEAGLSDGQSVLFLSFSRAAVSRILETARKEIPEGFQHLLVIQTFHSFYWEVLRAHAYLLGVRKRLTLLAPHDEKALSDGVEHNDQDQAWQDWKTERERLFYEEGRAAFELFAPKARELFERSGRIREMTSLRYPLIIVDEAQDTGPDQWACVKALSGLSQLLCLADLEQQIYDFLPGIGPERIQQIEADLNPVRIDLGSENNRSPDNEIAVFGYDILTGASRDGPYKGVSILNFHPRADRRDSSIRQSVGMISSTVEKETGRRPASIAMLASFDRGAIIISNALRQGNTPIPHKVLFDEAVTLLSSRFLAFLLEPKLAGNQKRDIATGLELLSSVFRAKGSVTSLQSAKKFQLWGIETLNDIIPTRAKVYRSLTSVVETLQTNRFSGDPRTDWTNVRKILRETAVNEFMALDRDLQYLMAFNRGKRIALGLASRWEEYGNYSNARHILDAAIAEDQIVSGGEDLSGIHVMTMHKSKGKQFDAVIIFRSGYASPFAWPKDPEPFHRSRKILRVAITRASLHTMILNEAFPSCPILSGHRL